MFRDLMHRLIKIVWSQTLGRILYDLGKSGITVLPRDVPNKRLTAFIHQCSCEKVLHSEMELAGHCRNTKWNIEIVRPTIRLHVAGHAFVKPAGDFRGRE